MTGYIIVVGAAFVYSLGVVGGSRLPASSKGELCPLCTVMGTTYSTAMFPKSGSYSYSTVRECSTYSW